MYTVAAPPLVPPDARPELRVGARGTTLRSVAQTVMRHVLLDRVHAALAVGDVGGAAPALAATFREFNNMPRSVFEATLAFARAADARVEAELQAAGGAYLPPPACPPRLSALWAFATRSHSILQLLVAAAPTQPFAVAFTHAYLAYLVAPSGTGAGSATAPADRPPLTALHRHRCAVAFDYVYELLVDADGSASGVRAKMKEAVARRDGHADATIAPAAARLPDTEGLRDIAAVMAGSDDASSDALSSVRPRHRNAAAQLAAMLLGDDGGEEEEEEVEGDTDVEEWEGAGSGRRGSLSSEVLARHHRSVSGGGASDMGSSTGTGTGAGGLKLKGRTRRYYSVSRAGSMEGPDGGLEGADIAAVTAALDARLTGSSDSAGVDGSSSGVETAFTMPLSDLLHIYEATYAGRTRAFYARRWRAVMVYDCRTLLLGAYAALLVRDCALHAEAQRQAERSMAMQRAMADRLAKRQALAGRGVTLRDPDETASSVGAGKASATGSHSKADLRSPPDLTRGKGAPAALASEVASISAAGVMGEAGRDGATLTRKRTRDAAAEPTSQPSAHAPTADARLVDDGDGGGAVSSARPAKRRKSTSSHGTSDSEGGSVGSQKNWHDDDDGDSDGDEGGDGDGEKQTLTRWFVVNGVDLHTREPRQLAQFAIRALQFAMTRLSVAAIDPATWRLQAVSGGDGGDDGGEGKATGGQRSYAAGFGSADSLVSSHIASDASAAAIIASLIRGAVTPNKPHQRSHRLVAPIFTRLQRPTGAPDHVFAPHAGDMVAALADALWESGARGRAFRICRRYIRACLEVVRELWLRRRVTSRNGLRPPPTSTAEIVATVSAASPTVVPAPPPLTAVFHAAGASRDASPPLPGCACHVEPATGGAGATSAGARPWPHTATSRVGCWRDILLLATHATLPTCAAMPPPMPLFTVLAKLVQLYSRYAEAHPMTLLWADNLRGGSRGGIAPTAGDLAGMRELDVRLAPGAAGAGGGMAVSARVCLSDASLRPLDVRTPSLTLLEWAFALWALRVLTEGDGAQSIATAVGDDSAGGLARVRVLARGHGGSDDGAAATVIARMPRAAALLLACVRDVGKASAAAAAVGAGLAVDDGTAGESADAAPVDPVRISLQVDGAGEAVSLVGTVKAVVGAAARSRKALKRWRAGRSAGEAVDM